MKVLLLFLSLVVSISAYTYIKGPSRRLEVAPCPGFYCGRMPVNKTHNSACGPCKRGWRVGDKFALAGNITHSVCQRCESHPEPYDYFYLAFHAILVLCLHWFFIDLTAKRRKFTKEVILFHCLAFLEVIVASLTTLLLSEPRGQLDLVSCETEKLADWYTFLYNPNPNYDHVIHCTQEVVYPLYTIVFLFYFLCLITMLLTRPFIASKFYPRRGGATVYAAMYFLPVLAVMHGVLGGLVYKAYPYIVLILSVISSASHFAFKLDQSLRALLTGCFTDQRNFVILVGHWLLHAFGIVAIAQLQKADMHLAYLALVPIPATFYILTARFTDPTNFAAEMNS